MLTLLPIFSVNDSEDGMIGAVFAHRQRVTVRCLGTSWIYITILSLFNLQQLSMIFLFQYLTRPPLCLQWSSIALFQNRRFDIYFTPGIGLSHTISMFLLYDLSLNLSDLNNAPMLSYLITDMTQPTQL